jgi:predicted 2-oxoglutarate/Fe(II)-dependent dioxygenase YbiX
MAKVSAGVAFFADSDSGELVVASVFGVLAESAPASSVPRYPRPYISSVRDVTGGDTRVGLFAFALYFL